MSQPTPDFDATSWLQAWQQHLSQGHTQFDALMKNVLETALDSGGASLLEGARLFLADAAKGRISMSDAASRPARAAWCSRTS